jgi:dipeptide/tripeptide permease
VYLTPLLGAYLADAVMGRFWVIFAFSLVYFVVGDMLAYLPGTMALR